MIPGLVCSAFFPCTLVFFFKKRYSVLKEIHPLNANERGMKTLIQNFFESEKMLTKLLIFKRNFQNLVKKLFNLMEKTEFKSHMTQRNKWPF